MKLRVPLKTRSVLTSRVTVSFSWRALLHVLGWIGTSLIVEESL
jgi:hypothetical protein